MLAVHHQQQRPRRSSSGGRRASDTVPTMPGTSHSLSNHSRKMAVQYVSDDDEIQLSDFHHGSSSSGMLLDGSFTISGHFTSQEKLQASSCSMMSFTSGEEDYETGEEYETEDDADFERSGLLMEDSMSELPALVEDEVVLEDDLPALVEDEAVDEMPALLEDEIVEDIDREGDEELVTPAVPVTTRGPSLVLQVDRAIGHVDTVATTTTNTSDEEDAPVTVEGTGSPKERRRSSKTKRSSLRSSFGSTSSSRRPSRVKSADAATLKNRFMMEESGSSSSSGMYLDESGSGHNNDDELMGESSQRSTSSRRRSRRMSDNSSKRLSRSRTTDARTTVSRVASNTGLTAMKNALTGGGSSSSNNKPSPTKRRPSRKKSSEAQKLRRNRSAVARQASNSGALSRMSRMLRRPPSRQNTVDGSSAPGLFRSQTTMDELSSSDRGSGSLRRNRTADERSLPKRGFNSSAVLARRGLPLRSKSKSGHKRPSRTSSGHKRPSRTSSLRAPPTSLNIFGSDMVSTEFILSQLQELEQNTDIVSLEMEDCLVTQRALAIPLRLKEVLSGDIRPWEGIHFVDELLDGLTQYKDFKRSRKHFHKALGGVCAHQVIPVSYKVKVHLRDNDNDNDDDDNAAILDLLQQLQKDVTVTTLQVSTKKASLATVQALAALLQCDDRAWADDYSMRWEIACAPEPNEVVAAGGLEQWQAAVKTAMEELTKVTAAKEIVLAEPEE